MSTTSPRGEAQLRKLARAQLTVTPAPGQAAKKVPALEVVRAGERCLAVEDFSGALQIGEQLRKTDGLASEGLRLMVLIAVALGRPRDAWQLASQLLATGVPDARTAVPLAEALQLCNRHGDALAVVDESLRDAPGDANLRNLRGRLLAEQNDPTGAEQELRRTLRLAPELYSPYRQLALLGRLTPEDMARLSTAALPEAGQVDAWMALAAGYRQQGEVVREFEYLRRAHALVKAVDAWEPEEERGMARDIEAQFTTAFLESVPALPAARQRPIFIVGMPRSGSTLAEQILASTGTNVGAAGESQVFPWLLLDLSRRRYGEMDYPQLATVLTRSDLEQLQRDYLQTISEVYTQSLMFVDKQFTNYKYIGLLARIFPDARFVHTVREPLDIILSTYQLVFRTVGFSHDLEHLAQAWVDRARIMAHWHRVLPGRIHDLVYEDVVANPEPTLRALVDFCGLPWSEKVLRFNETERTVKTASQMQVRKPLYQSSVARWKPYAALLEPARRVLAAATAAPTGG